MSNFVIGTDNFKKDVVRNHDKCEIHAFKAKPFVEAKSKIPGTAEKIIRNLNQNVMNKMKIVFRNAHAFYSRKFCGPVRFCVVQSIIWSAGPHVQLVFLLKFVHCTTVLG